MASWRAPSVGFTITTIKPKSFNKVAAEREFRGRILFALQETAERMKDIYREVVSTWEPGGHGEGITAGRNMQWKDRITYRGGIIGVEVWTEDPVFNWLDQGTSERHAVMKRSPLFIPKTVPGVLKSGPGQGGFAVVRREISQTSPKEIAAFRPRYLREGENIAIEAVGKYKTRITRRITQRRNKGEWQSMSKEMSRKIQDPYFQQNNETINYNVYPDLRNRKSEHAKKNPETTRRSYPWGQGIAPRAWSYAIRQLFIDGYEGRLMRAKLTRLMRSALAQIAFGDKYITTKMTATDRALSKIWAGTIYGGPALSELGMFEVTRGLQRKFDNIDRAVNKIKKKNILNPP